MNPPDHGTRIEFELGEQVGGAVVQVVRGTTLGLASGRRLRPLAASRHLNPGSFIRAQDHCLVRRIEVHTRDVAHPLARWTADARSPNAWRRRTWPSAPVAHRPPEELHPGMAPTGRPSSRRPDGHWLRLPQIRSVRPSHYATRNWSRCGRIPKQCEPWSPLRLRRTVYRSSDSRFSTSKLGLHVLAIAPRYARRWQAANCSLSVNASVLNVQK
jgi:hypothetical protein